MKTLLDTLKKARLALFALFALFAAAPAFSQSPSGFVMPRVYTLLSSGTPLTAHAYLGTNYGTNSVAAGYTNVYNATNTFMAFTGAHPIGLQVILDNTNAFAAGSNLVLTVYPAYDIGGGSSSTINPRYGTNFSQTPLLVWTLTTSVGSGAFGTHLYTTYSTNLLAAQWEPATSLGVTLSNTVNSNLTASVIMTVVP